MGAADVPDSAGHTARDLAALARAMQAGDSVAHTLHVICRLAVHAIEGTGHADITIRRHGALTTPAASDDIPTGVDRIQYETRQGPCLDALDGHDTVSSPDLGQEQRWPAFTARAITETGIRSMLSFRLFLGGDTIGALNLYSPGTDAFTPPGHALGAVFATHAAIAIHSAQGQDRAAHLQTALQSNRRIGAAVGILMSQQHLTEDQAFDQLRACSQRIHHKLHDVADHVLLTGELPEPQSDKTPAR